MTIADGAALAILLVLVVVAVTWLGAAYDEWRRRAGEGRRRRR